MYRAQTEKAKTSRLPPTSCIVPTSGLEATNRNRQTSSKWSATREKNISRAAACGVGREDMMAANTGGRERFSKAADWINFNNYWPKFQTQFQTGSETPKSGTRTKYVCTAERATYCSIMSYFLLHN